MFKLSYNPKIEVLDLVDVNCHALKYFNIHNEEE